MYFSSVLKIGNGKEDKDQRSLVLLWIVWFYRNTISINRIINQSYGVIFKVLNVLMKKICLFVDTIYSIGKNVMWYDHVSIIYLEWNILQRICIMRLYLVSKNEINNKKYENWIVF